jgi:ADP-ribose pyrophosphatase YjhB (NUDIX family)
MLTRLDIFGKVSFKTKIFTYTYKLSNLFFEIFFFIFEKELKHFGKKMEKSDKWLEWAREIQALAQIGLTYAANHYEEERNKRLMEIASEILAEYSSLEAEETKKVFMAQPGYATPKVDVRAAVVEEGKILLVRERTDGRWAMPGGWADVGDYPAKAAEREALEESGFVVKAKKVIGVFDANRSGRPLEFFHAVKIIFLCDLIGGKATPSKETSEVRFFDFDNLPPLSENRTNMKHINEIRLHLHERTRPTFFE